MPNRWPALLEFICIFVLLPLIVDRYLPHIAWFPLLWVVAWWVSRALPKAEREGRYGERARAFFKANRQTLERVLVRFCVSASLMTLALWWWAPERLFILVRQRAGFWALIMVLYPVLSVYPQEVIYRKYLFFRYGEFFPTKAHYMVVSEVVFAWLHIIFRNPWAWGMTLAGGLIFADTFWRTRSLGRTCLEHIIYGQFIFTIGLGEYLAPPRMM